MIDDEFDISTVDLLLVTHFHLDHCAALPYILYKVGTRLQPAQPSCQHHHHPRLLPALLFLFRCVCVCACGFLCAEVENRDLHADGGTRSACRSSATARHRQRDVGRVCALQTSFKGRVFMTHATKAIYHMMLSDFIRVSKVHLSLRLLSVALN
jgi:hypothetical protein